MWNKGTFPLLTSFLFAGANRCFCPRYGSVATNRDTVDSDLDVAVISSDFGHDRYREGTILNKVAWRIDPRLHPVPISSDSFQNETWIPLVDEIKRHGLEV